MKKMLIMPILVAALLTASLGGTACQKELQPLRIGVPPLEQNALLYVAESRGLFASNGLKVTISDYDTGAAAMNALLAGDVDVAETAEFPFVLQAFQQKPVRALAVNDRFENDYLMVRADRGIATSAGLKGKKIGLIRGTVLEFYLGRYLELNGLSLSDVTLVDTASTTQTTEALVKGEVDAAVAFQPYVANIQSTLGSGVLTWPVQNGQLVYGMLVSTAGWLNTNGNTVKQFLKALSDAETYLNSHPNEAREIVRQRLGFESSYLDSTWPKHQFDLSLNPSLLVAMNDEAHWVIQNGLTTATVAPDFHDYIYLDGLTSVKPGAVGISK